MKAERDQLDQEVSELYTKVGDLDLEKQTLADQLAQTQTELAKVRSQLVSPDVTKLDQENQNLLEQLEKVNSENEGLLKKLQQIRAELEEVRSQKNAASNSPIPDLTKIRDRILAELKLGKSAPRYKAAKELLDKFIKQLEVGQ